MYQTLHILLNINDPSYLIYILVLILIIGAILYFGKPKRKNADELFEYGLRKVNLGDIEGAIETFSKAIEINPNHDESYFHRAIEKEKIKQFDSAREDYSACIKINPNLAEYHWNRAFLKDDKNDFHGVIIDYSNFIKLWKEANGAMTYRHAFHNRGKAYFELKQFENAVKDFTKVVQLDPDSNYSNPGSDSPYIILAKLKVKLENFDGAIQDCNTLLSLEPENKDAMITLQAVKLQKKENEEKSRNNLTEKEETLIDNATNKKQDAQDNNDLKENIVEYFESDDYKKYKERLEHIWERIEEKISGKDIPDGNYYEQFRAWEVHFQEKPFKPNRPLDQYLKEEGTYKNQLREGKWKFYYSNGELAVECSFKNDQREGEYLEYHVNGQIATKENFINDKVHGNVKIWHQNGDLKGNLEFKNGELEEYGKLDQAEFYKTEDFDQKKNSSENKAVNSSKDVNQMVNDFSNETYDNQYFDCNLALFALYKEEYSFVKHIRSKMKTGKITNQEEMGQIIKNELNQYDVGTLGEKQYMFGETTKMLGTFLNNYDSIGEKGFKGYEEIEQYHSISGHIIQMMPDILMVKMMSGK